MKTVNFDSPHEVYSHKIFSYILTLSVVWFYGTWVLDGIHTPCTNFLSFHYICISTGSV